MLGLKLNDVVKKGPRKLKSFFTRDKDQFVSYTRVYETSAGCLRSIYSSLGMRQLFDDVTIGQWRHN